MTLFFSTLIKYSRKILDIILFYRFSLLDVLPSQSDTTIDCK